MAKLLLVAVLFVLLASRSTAVNVASFNIDTLTQRFFPEHCRGNAKYAIIFRYNWTESTNPRLDFPTAGPVNGPGFAPLVYAGHNKYWTMWAPGAFANRGPEQAAEGGNPAQLLREMSRERNIFHSGAAPGPVAATASRRVEVDLRGPTGQTYLSAMSMIAPSPDWFVGVYNVNMCYRGAWVEGAVVGRLRGYDAGTSEDGEEFTDLVAPRVDERPRKVAERLGEGFGDFGVVRIVRVTE